MHKLIYLLLFVLSEIPVLGQEYCIIDSRLTFDKAVSGLIFPESVKNNLVLTDVLYYSLDGRIHQGQLVVHKDLEQEIKEIFYHILESRFPVNKVIPISVYNWNDSLSMSENNTSAFNYRKVSGTRVVSAHSMGRAIDINPFLNPQIRNKSVVPFGAEWNPKIPGTLTRNSPVVRAFLKRGWQWGGSWRSTKDYQHFEKK